MKEKKELYDYRMDDKETQGEKIGDLAVRSNRSEWAESLETNFRSKAPFPASYDIECRQTTNFSEFSYTELLNGFWGISQSPEINCRVIQEASTIHNDQNFDHILNSIQDKYEQVNINPNIHYDKVCFLPGSNKLDAVDISLIKRLVYEEDNIFFKLHPITVTPAINMIKSVVGLSRIIPGDVSAAQIIKNTSEVYTTSCSEMVLTATILGKKLFNISKFEEEGTGAYFPISRILYLEHKRNGIQAAQQKLLNIFNCSFSGTFFPWQSDIDERIEAFFKTTLNYRLLLKPMAITAPPKPQQKPKEEKESCKCEN
jgi:hypothetical protein